VPLLRKTPMESGFLAMGPLSLLYSCADMRRIQADRFRATSVNRAPRASFSLLALASIAGIFDLL